MKEQKRRKRSEELNLDIRKARRSEKQKRKEGKTYEAGEFVLEEEPPRKKQKWANQVKKKASPVVSSVPSYTDPETHSDVNLPGPSGLVLPVPLESEGLLQREEPEEEPSADKARFGRTRYPQLHYAVFDMLDSDDELSDCALAE